MSSDNTDGTAFFQKLVGTAIMALLDANLPHTAAALHGMQARLDGCDACGPTTDTYVFIQDAAFALTKLAGSLSLEPVAEHAAELRASLTSAAV